jgi:hypothetical protein
MVSTFASTSGTKLVRFVPPAMTPVSNITFWSGCAVESAGAPCAPMERLCPVERMKFTSKARYVAPSPPSSPGPAASVGPPELDEDCPELLPLDEAPPELPEPLVPSSRPRFGSAASSLQAEPTPRRTTPKPISAGSITTFANRMSSRYHPAHAA